MKALHNFLSLSFLGVGLVSLFSQCDSSGNRPEKDSLTTSITTTEPIPDSIAKMIGDSLPFTLDLVEQVYTNKKALPRLQSYASAISASGEILVVGGRRQGLHTFKEKPSNNFVPDSSNNFIYVINPEKGDTWAFDVNQLSVGELSAALQSTNQQFYYDEAKDQLYVLGGYGWKKDKSDMKTFNTLIRFSVTDMINAIKTNAPASKIQALFEMTQNDFFAVTGGELFRLNGTFYLVFGQRFDGQYRAFGGSDFTQKYTEEVRVFTLKPNALALLTSGKLPGNPDPDQPFHRRDGNTIDDIDPATGKARITALGGVFKPGIIGAYTNPIYISGGSTPIVDRKIDQRFSQYECPVVSIYYPQAKDTSVYHTFFGGISHYYFFQTPSHKQAYDSVTTQGRNDGFPFISDISTLQLSAKGTSKECFLPKPLPNNRLLGASARFILHPDLSKNKQVFENGVIRLNTLAENQRVLIGYIYGGIEAQNPLPLIPNTGTFVSNSVFKVYLTKKSYGVIPASKAKESKQNLFKR